MVSGAPSAEGTRASCACFQNCLLCDHHDPGTEGRQPAGRDPRRSVANCDFFFFKCCSPRMSPTRSCIPEDKLKWLREGHLRQKRTACGVNSHARGCGGFSTREDPGAGRTGVGLEVLSGVTGEGGTCSRAPVPQHVCRVAHRRRH